MDVTIIGGGLAGSEAAWHLAQEGHEVTLWEMRPEHQTPAHETGLLAELVCSNSLGALELTSASGLLKEEMSLLGSLILEKATKASLPAGGALAVDREEFSRSITEAIEGEPRIRIIREEIKSIPDGVVILASGPLTSPALASALQERTGQEHLAFYDAAAPIVTLESVDQSRGFWASRYDKGSGEYFNCPLSKVEYQAFWEELTQAEVASRHDFEKDLFFEGCMPIEALAARGRDTLRYGPFKPVGLIDPQEERRPYAVLQLRQDNREGTLYNLVGCQTSLRWGEQKRIFQMIPALREAEFVRYGVMHRNTFLKAPALLTATYQLREEPRIFVAGQITGVEGYLESAASGLCVGYQVNRVLRGESPREFPLDTLLGALPHYLSTASAKHFQPMNANFGLLPPLPEQIRDKKERKRLQAQRALESLGRFLQTI